MKSSKTSFLRNCISGWNVRGISERGKICYLEKECLISPAKRELLSATLHFRSCLTSP